MDMAKTISIPIELQLSPKSQALLNFLKALDADAAPTPPAPAAKTLTGNQQPPAHGEYWQGQGGYYICTLPALLGMPARHLIAGADEAEDLTFGPTQEIAGAGSHIDGAANTAALLNSGEKHPAAEWARAYTADGHTDFFLPSRYDLFMAYLCAPNLFKTSGWYWSSTQLSRSSAFVQDFEYGYSGWDSEVNEHRSRAFRVIQLQPFCA